MSDLDVTILREYAVEVFNLKNLDREHTFYYDETNNARRFVLEDKSFNVDSSMTFVLAGVMHKGNNYEADIDMLYSSLKLQKTINELKFRHVAKGDFLNCLNSRKLNTFLKWLLKSDLYVHLSTLNLLYFSLVDIVDSAIANSEISKKLGRDFADLLKNELYKLTVDEEDYFIRIFNYFDYPNVQPEKIIQFTDALIYIIEKYNHVPERHLGLESLRQILKETKKTGKLVFIIDEKSKVLIDDFRYTYLKSTYMFSESKHIFDNEDLIVELVKDIDIVSHGKKIQNYEFALSHENRLTQISDVFTGLVGKMVNFANSNTYEEISRLLLDLNDMQKANRQLLSDVISKSDNYSHALIDTTVSHEERRKYELIYL